MPKPVDFLSVEIVLLFHARQIERSGGTEGLRDRNLLDSAVAQAQSSFDGVYLHKTLYEMAAAYGWHLCNNHAFLDGNKRVALVAMVAFLMGNGYRVTASEEEMYLVLMMVANGKMTKLELAKFLRKNTLSL